MSEVVTIGTATATIHGTYAAAVDYVSTMFGDAYTTWLGFDVDDRKRTLVAATRYLDRQAWSTDYATFAARDAVDAFKTASYELAALAAEDASVLSAVDSGSNIKSVGAGGAFVDYFNPTSQLLGNATKLPPILQALLGAYLATSDVLASLGGAGEDGDCHDPFNDCSDYDRNEPY